MSLGIGNAKPLKPFAAPKAAVSFRMITTEAAIHGFQVESSLGLVEGVAEISTPGVAIPHMRKVSSPSAQQLLVKSVQLKLFYD